MYAHHDGVKLFYQTTGGSGPELFLHPPSQPVVYSRAWKYQLAYLSRYFRVTVLDPRGNGRSDRPPAGYDLDTRYRDLLAVLDAAVRPPFAFVALACSAMLAFRYAVEHPDRLSHLILVSGQYAESVPGPFDEKVAPVIRNDFDNWRRRLFTRTFQEPHSLKGIEDGMAWTAETTPEVLVESLRAIDGTSVLDLLGRSRVPTLALHGTRDKIVPYSHAQKMVAAIPGARLVTFEGGGHGLPRRVGEQWGERLHPATRRLLNDSAHIEGWAGDHELHAFNALWDMDENMAANFMTFADVVERERYDLWVSDEGLDLDYYLHENPDLKRAPYVFLTDFIGMLPMRDDPGSTEFVRCREKNAENVDHLKVHPDVRDLSLLVGDAEDVLDRPFGPDLPNMRGWAREHFSFPGYTWHFDPAAYRDRAALRSELGYREGERVILVSVGGTRVGRHLLVKCAEAFTLVAPRMPDTRMILVAGPRLDPAELPRPPRLDVRAFVPDLFRHHAAADLAVVQGGLTTTMELTAFRTPFLYFPLRNHFEQNFHVARRLERLGP